MAPASESFGDRRLINSAIAPVRSHERGASATELAALWGALAISPGIYAIALGSLTWQPSMLALLGALLVAWALAASLGRTSLRYGIGLVPAARAACGSRGASPVLLVRWAVGMLWIGVWAVELGEALSHLAEAATGWPVGLLVVPGSRGLTFGAWGLGAFVLVVAALLARGGALWIRRAAALTGLGAAGLGLGLVVFGGIASRGFGSLLRRQAEWSALDVASALVVALLWMAPAIAAVPDWLRFGPSVRRRVPWGVRLVPATLVGAGMLTAFVGSLLAAASVVGRGRFDASPIPDAAGFGGLAGGYGGALLALLLFLTVAPVVGLYSPALALSGILPSRLGYRGALKLTVAAAFVLMPLARLLELHGERLAWLIALLGPLLGLLWVDERFVRRGRVMLEDLYLAKSEYGPWLGTRPSALLALLAGWALHPLLWPVWRDIGHVGIPAWLAARSTVVQAAVAALAGALLTGGLYGLARSLSALALRLDDWRYERSRRRHRQREREPEPALIEDASTTHAIDDADLPPGWGDDEPLGFRPDDDESSGDAALVSEALASSADAPEQGREVPAAPDAPLASEDADDSESGT